MGVRPPQASQNPKEIGAYTISTPRTVSRKGNWADERENTKARMCGLTRPVSLWAPDLGEYIVEGAALHVSGAQTWGQLPVQDPVGMPKAQQGVSNGQPNLNT